MKRFLRVFIPILMVLAIIFSIGWYLIKYDPALTRDVLISQARAMEDRGNHSAATWFYNMAYHQSGNDETIALELARQYQSMGNYTKAEFTLSNAIADGGSVELYMALCNVYVEQNKLLDAVNMLDNVSNPAIKTQLDRLRPQAVAVDQEPGYYNRYITLTFTAPDSTIYLTTDGSYPSRGSAPYNLPIPLDAGETVINALAVGKNGLVSPLSILSYTVAGVVEEVVIDDAAIDAAVREQLQVTGDHTLYTNELWTITELDVPHKAASLSDLSKLPFLTRLTMDNMKFDSLSALSSLSALEELVISEMSVSDADLRTIAQLPNLNSLTLVQCSLSSIAPLSEATGLTYLNLGGNTIRNLTALNNLTSLKELRLNHNAVTDLHSLSSLPALEVLDLSFNSITTPAPLSHCTALRELDLSNNVLTDIAGLEALQTLENLSLAFTGLTDVSALEQNAALLELDISNNALTDISTLSKLKNLTHLNFSYNQVEKLPQFGKDHPLVNIKGSKNNLTSLEGLEELMCLNYVKMDFNEKLTSADPLLKCYALIELSVYGTDIHDVSQLRQMGVIVLYSPI